ncbi:hypothetical protein M422DRAFT_223714 [Sphaerobolus stellatus SS14]|nr:hypothetical protein M422DRAFT_223714 [Sphaerobolus stellatus SS14]
MSLITRRKIILLFAILTSCFLFYQYVEEDYTMNLGRMGRVGVPGFSEDPESKFMKPVIPPSTSASSTETQSSLPSTSTPKSSSGSEKGLQKAQFPRPSDGALDAQFVSWGESEAQMKMPTTEVIVHVPGWTILENLYLWNGTMYIVTDDPTKIPDRAHLTSSGAFGNQPAHEILPTDQHMQIVTPAKAQETFGMYASWMDGTSFVLTESHQFIPHYYHWCAEAFFGLWRTYSLLDPNIDEEGHTDLPAPRRIMFPNVTPDHFRDAASLTVWFTRAVFPAISLEFKQQWADRASMPRPFLLERVVLGDREASLHSPEVNQMRRTSLELFKPALGGSPYWWSTIRNSFVHFTGFNPAGQKPGNVITYVSRQTWKNRMLRKEDHEKLVKALTDLSEKHGYELNIVSMERLTKDEQIQLAAKTTILLGVHGNGLTALLWMKPSKRATVMEFFYPQGFTLDYEWPTRILGMKHYGFWGDKYFTFPDLPKRNYPPGYHGNEIPIDADLVAKLCHERLSLPED